MISVTVEKDEAGPYLSFVSAQASDFTAPITQVLNSGMDDARETIRGGGPDFGWAPYAPWTFKVDKAIGRTRIGMLQEKGRLLGSIGNVFEVGPTEGKAGSNLPHARFQQEGTDKTFFFLQFLSTGKREFGGRGITPRPFMWWHEEKFPEYDAMFMSHLTGEA